MTARVWGLGREDPKDAPERGRALELLLRRDTGAVAVRKGEEAPQAGKTAFWDTGPSSSESESYVLLAVIADVSESVKAFALDNTG
ncbi:hypothetical protein CB1_000569018 [Camelus ferus]|nr:hypothetical protein CB1_000569018 [Camelus ferus]